MTETILKWAIVLTGIYDILLGAALLRAPTNDAPARANWASALTLAGFLIFAGAVLIWAAQDLGHRGPVVAWQGLLRLFAAGAIFIAIHRGYMAGPIAKASNAAAWIDVGTALLYFVALIGVWHWRPLALLLGRAA